VWKGGTGFLVARDKTMAANIVSQFETQNRQMMAVNLVGSAHLKGIAKHLTAAGFQEVALDSTAPFQSQ
jgi:pheromone shutdown protein TraB